ncbi:MAG: sugar ABC transporter permease, partial [Bauldia sp.]|nr:sugar ABC transporter permease [Bauldia sp.]
MERQLFGAFIAIVVGVGACALYYYAANMLLDLALPFRKGAQAVRNQKVASLIRPWLFLLPAILILGIYLVYPAIESLWLSFHDRAGENFVGVNNYVWAVNDDEFRQSIFNNVLWLLVVPALSTFFGLVIAFLTDRIWWGNIAKTLIFMPMAISFVGASVIWKFIYDYRSEGSTQIGLLNAIVQGLGGEPQAWITIPFWNSFFLMVILI